MPTRKPILSAVLLCSAAVLSMGNDGGCGGSSTQYCGDGVCGGGEDSTSCSADCPITGYCGDGICNVGESAASCSLDCGVDPDCSGGVCDDEGDESNCAADCDAAPFCGDGTCDPDENSASSCPADCGSPSDVRPSAGCGLAGDSGRQDLTVTIRGVQRTYRVQFPANYDPNEPLPLIFYFHWMDGTIDEVLSTSGPAIWEVGNASNEAAFVWPQGLTVYGGDQTGWDLLCDGEDMEFFDAMLSKLADSRCIDLSRVFAAGFSFGADMSVSLACCRDASVVRAVAPTSGAFDQYIAEFVCPGLSPPSMRYSYGSVDPVYTPSEFNDVITFFHAQLGCSTDYDWVSVSPCGETWTEDGSTVTCSCKSYRGCSRPLIDCEFVNMGHTTPLGWPEDTWDYFMSF